jgi:hypothetical protein
MNPSSATEAALVDNPEPWILDSNVWLQYSLCARHHRVLITSRGFEESL